MFVDIDPLHLGMHDQGIINALNENTRAVFTHAQGFSALSNKLNALEKEIFISLKICESHGAKHNGKKLDLWLGIKFSFYYAHLSTIGGE